MLWRCSVCTRTHNATHSTPRKRTHHTMSVVARLHKPGTGIDHTDISGYSADGLWPTAVRQTDRLAPTAFWHAQTRTHTKNSKHMCKHTRFAPKAEKQRRVVFHTRPRVFSPSFRLSRPADRFAHPIVPRFAFHYATRSKSTRACRLCAAHVF